MLEQIAEALLPHVVDYLLTKNKLTPRQQQVQNEFVADLTPTPRKTPYPLIVAVIGLTGAGKSSVARELVKHLGGTIITGKNIRGMLQERGEPVTQAPTIAEHLMIDILQHGGNAIVDSDHINMDAKNRAQLRKRAAALGAHLVFLAVVCDFYIAIKSILPAWQENQPSAQASAKLVELLDRIPYHYEWSKRDGGKWRRKRLPFTPFAEITTSYEGAW
ncbi:MAG TPA: AAA family ATPase [Candidatus Binatia bacterium]|nr:AAA family ATPase [Candidatus Binatia bacterium]